MSSLPEKPLRGAALAAAWCAVSTGSYKDKQHRESEQLVVNFTYRELVCLLQLYTHGTQISTKAHNVESLKWVFKGKLNQFYTPKPVYRS